MKPSTAANEKKQNTRGEDVDMQQMLIDQCKQSNALLAQSINNLLYLNQQAASGIQPKNISPIQSKSSGVTLFNDVLGSPSDTFKLNTSSVSHTHLSKQITDRVQNKVKKKTFAQSVPTAKVATTLINVNADDITTVAMSYTSLKSTLPSSDVNVASHHKQVKYNNETQMSQNKRKDPSRLASSKAHASTNKNLRTNTSASQYTAISDKNRSQSALTEDATKRTRRSQATSHVDKVSASQLHVNQNKDSVSTSQLLLSQSKNDVPRSQLSVNQGKNNETKSQVSTNQDRNSRSHLSTKKDRHKQSTTLASNELKGYSSKDDIFSNKGEGLLDITEYLAKQSGTPVSQVPSQSHDDSKLIVSNKRSSVISTSQQTLPITTSKSRNSCQVSPSSASIMESKLNSYLPKPRVNDPRLSSQLPKSPVNDPRLSAQLPKSPVNDPRLSAQLSKSPVNDPRLSAQLSKSQVSDPRLSTELPKSQVSDPRLSTELPKPQVSDPRLSAELHKPQVSDPRLSAEVPKSPVNDPRLCAHLPKSPVNDPRLSAERIARKRSLSSTFSDSGDSVFSTSGDLGDDSPLKPHNLSIGSDKSDASDKPNDARLRKSPLNSDIHKLSFSEYQKRKKQGLKFTSITNSLNPTSSILSPNEPSRFVNHQPADANQNSIITNEAISMSPTSVDKETDNQASFGKGKDSNTPIIQKRSPQCVDNGSAEHSVPSNGKYIDDEFFLPRRSIGVSNRDLPEHISSGSGKKEEAIQRSTSTSCGTSTASSDAAGGKFKKLSNDNSTRVQKRRSIKTNKDLESTTRPKWLNVRIDDDIEHEYQNFLKNMGVTPRKKRSNSKTSNRKKIITDPDKSIALSTSKNDTEKDDGDHHTHEGAEDEKISYSPVHSRNIHTSSPSCTAAVGVITQGQSDVGAGKS